MIGADLLAGLLKTEGVTFVSALCGNGITPFLEAADRAGLRVIDTRNEQTAAYMAETYARFTRRVGVCAVSSAVGFTNALSGVVNAWFDGAPMLLLAGASDQTFAGRGSFQDFDQVRVAASMCKYARFVERPDKIPFYLHEALAAATSGRPGPVHLTVPADVLAAPVSGGGPPFDRTGAAVVCQECRPMPEALSRAVQAIARAKRPLLVAGSGVFYAQAEDALARFVGQTDMPVVVPIWDRGSISATMPQFMGVIGAASGGPRLLDSADLIILAGARVDYRVGYLQPPAVQPSATVVRISMDATELRQGIEPHIAVHGDPRSVFEQLTGMLPSQPSAVHREWREEAQRRDAEFRARWRRPLQTGETITGQHIVEALRPFVQDDTVLVADGGNIGQWLHMALCDRYPGHWMTCGASGVVGFGIGGAMAAKLAYPDRPVILLSGDGSFGFNLADLESATRHRLPFVAIVADDQAWGIVVSGQRKQARAAKLVSSTLGPLRFDLVAQACGGYGVYVQDASQLGPTIRQALDADRPFVIQVPIQVGGPAD